MEVGASTFAAAGSVLGPWGALAGGVVGGIIGGYLGEEGTKILIESIKNHDQDLDSIDYLRKELLQLSDDYEHAPALRKEKIKKDIEEKAKKLVEWTTKKQNQKSQNKGEIATQITKKELTNKILSINDYNQKREEQKAIENAPKSYQERLEKLQFELEKNKSMLSVFEQNLNSRLIQQTPKSKEYRNNKIKDLKEKIEYSKLSIQKIKEILEYTNKNSVTSLPLLTDDLYYVPNIDTQKLLPPKQTNGQTINILSQQDELSNIPKQQNNMQINTTQKQLNNNQVLLPTPTKPALSNTDVSFSQRVISFFGF